ncbi:sigma factor-like helix-turn-helix DNA-binding protein [Amycolatopsis taiwanensis]|uniref:sigma factor-like helix-turn-helix DNA-binding protein n=1 Tax=Amycolatopsis taiwanensis TaxID=342230 RepID=UPI0012EB229E|nr:sigma factor-like helix-turn-helix DNA-binding protein [Amycolatopsis taiwanensis]
MSSPVKTRPHGRTKYVVEKCHCEVCRTASRAYENHRRRQRAYGRQAYVDAEPARQHVRKLQAAGLGWKRVAQLAGLDHSVVWKLIYGDRKRFDGPSKRIRPETERKILAVRATLDNLGDNALVDGTGTRRRLEALIAMGWSKAKLAARLGMTPTNFGSTMQRARLHAATVRAVRVLYNELWDIRPPEDTHRDKIAASRARTYAQRHGFVPPQAWDDDTIDDPVAQPEGTEPVRRKGVLPPAEELLYLRKCGESVAAIAARFGVKENTVEQALHRARAVAA